MAGTDDNEETDWETLSALVADLRNTLEGSVPTASLAPLLDVDAAALPPEVHDAPAPVAPERRAQDRTAPPRAPATPPPPPDKPAPRVRVPTSIPSRWATIADTARRESEEQLTHGALGLRKIREDLGDCRRCQLCRDRRNIVFGAGDPEADLVLVGEAPGRHEDVQGVPFVGEAGQMLDRMLENVVGLKRDQVYICNVVKCRPPSNRNPLPPEVDACLPFLQRQIEVIAPKVILVMGTVAFKNLFAENSGIMRNRGVWREYRGIPALPMFHPAYLLRQPQEKNKAFADLKALKTRYVELDGKQ